MANVGCHGGKHWQVGDADVTQADAGVTGSGGSDFGLAAFRGDAWGSSVRCGNHVTVGAMMRRKHPADMDYNRSRIPFVEIMRRGAWPRR